MTYSSRSAIRVAHGAACLAVGLLCAVSCAGQDAAPSELKANPLTALREFEAPLNQDYTLGRGDEIAIDFAGRPELTVRRVIGPDGRITLPPAGSLVVADKTREDAAKAIETALAPYYTRVSVTVGVDKYTSNKVLLLGAVERPGPVLFDAPPTLLEVLTVGGGLSRASQVSSLPGVTATSNQPRVSGTMPERVAIYRGSEQVMWVDVKGLIDSGNSLADLRLKRGDVVYVPSSAERYVSVLGQVGHPGALQLDNNTTLAKLLAEAGGITSLAGKNPSIEVVSPATGQKRIVPFKALLQPGPVDVTLKSGDVVFVTESGFNQASYVLDKLSPLVTLFTAGAFLAQ
jgi:polysaccharide export outer membrane protein